jgi:Tfp pilus assembly protein PilF
LNNLGNAYLLSGDEKEAENIFKHILTKDSKNVLALGNLAVIYKDRNDIALSKKMLDRVLEIDPNDTRAKSLLESLSK